MALSYQTVSANAASGSALSFSTSSFTLIAGTTILLASVCSGNTSVTVTPGQSGWTQYTPTPIANNPQVQGGNNLFFWRLVQSGDPTSYTFAFSTSDINNGSLTAINGGADPNNPFVQSSTQNFNNTGNSAGYTQSISLPQANNIGCMPLAYFVAQNPNGTSPGVTRSSGWTETFIQSTTNAAYHASEGQVGPFSTDMSSPITATAQWANGGTINGQATLILVQPAVLGPLVSSPASGAMNVTGIGPTYAIQATISQANNNGNIVVTPRSNTPGAVSLSTTQNGTYASGPLTLTGPSATYWIQGNNPGPIQLDIQGG